MSETLQWLLPHLSQWEWALHILVFAVNIGLFFLAKPLLDIVSEPEATPAKVLLFKALNVFVLILHLLDLVLLRLDADYEDYFVSIGLSLMAIYAGMFIYSLCCYFSKRRFGNRKELDEKVVYLDTYSTRLVNLIILAIIVVTVIYALIKIWGADSMLETTGIFGILAALLAFTSSVWAPDIISGLIILNTQMLEDGDVVVVDGFPDEYIISKVTLFYVILYNIRNNHRTIMRNSQFTQRKIDNLSKLASTDGVRQALVYKIGYPSIDIALDDEQRRDALKSFRNRVDRMFEAAFDYCGENKEIKINANSPFEWALTSTGDYALEYTLWVYLERIPNTKLTATIRKHLMGTLYKVNQAVFVASIDQSLDLATPDLLAVQVQPNQSDATTRGDRDV